MWSVVAIADTLIVILVYLNMLICANIHFNFGDILGLNMTITSFARKSAAGWLYLLSYLCITPTNANAQSHEYGIEYIDNTSGILYIVDEGWTGNFRYLCLNNYCINGSLVDGRWQRPVSGLSVGTQYNVEFKIQDK